MVRRLILLLLIAGCAHTEAQIGSRSGASSAQVRAVGGAAVVLGVAAALADPYQPDRPPELDPNRQINEQDCTQPVDFTAGNLRCR